MRTTTEGRRSPAPTSTSEGRVVVAGGGIAGLATSLALAHVGFEVEVLERRPEFRELGAGIQLAPNAFRALHRLGVRSAVLDRAVFVEELRLADGLKGHTLARLPLGDAFRTRFSHPYVVVHRNDLLAALHTAASRHPAIRLRPSSPVVGYEQSSTDASAVLADGRRVSGHLVVGADGLHSAVRAQLVGDGAPPVTGHTIYRTVLPAGDVPPELWSNAVVLWAGPGLHVVHYPISGGTQLNLAGVIDNDAPSAVAGAPADRDEVLDLFEGLARAPRRLMEAGARWRRWVLCDRAPVHRWRDGRVVLLGDAAHPMLQYAAQGAAMALEDAVALGEELAGHEGLGGPAGPTGTNGPAAALAAFEARRHDRTALLHGVARFLGDRIYHAAGTAAADRDKAVALDERDLWAKVAWIYDGETPAAAHPAETTHQPGPPRKATEPQGA